MNELLGSDWPRRHAATTRLNWPECATNLADVLTLDPRCFWRELSHRRSAARSEAARSLWPRL
ncbi:protein of unknown function [Methylocaldum szegediense]|uniref:Uncharacterized protein n=1 Tax=Methylocaldum szegediense TaxID=73780 RepID=A0ABM9HZA6_9GAMM|nr:protein of unknown function [Methylocaldum szegediense]